MKCEGRDAYHGSPTSSAGILRAVKNKHFDSERPFDTRKFWLSSAAFFAGLLAIALLPSCANAAAPQEPHQGAWTSSIEQP